MLPGGLKGIGLVIPLRSAGVYNDFNYIILCRAQKLAAPGGIRYCLPYRAAGLHLFDKATYLLNSEIACIQIRTCGKTLFNLQVIRAYPVARYGADSAINNGRIKLQAAVSGGGFHGRKVFRRFVIEIKNQYGIILRVLNNPGGGDYRHFGSQQAAHSGVRYPL